MYTLLIILTIIVAVLMCLIVLIQESKGGGLASSFSSSNQIMGVRKTTDVVEKATWTLAVLLVLFSIFSVFFLPKASAGSESVLMKSATEQKATNANNLPGFDASQVPAETSVPAETAPVQPAN